MRKERRRREAASREVHCVVSSGLLLCSTRWHALILPTICGALRSMLAGVLKKGRLSCGEVTVGSGQLGTPWERMQRANWRMSLHACCTWAGVGWPLFGRRCSQAL